MAKIKHTQVETAATQLAVATDQNFKFLMSRFDRIEHQNDEQLTLLRQHIEVDAVVHKVVERHSTYFSVLALGIPVGITALMHKLGWKGL
jgi:helix-turn-helix protein